MSFNDEEIVVTIDAKRLIAIGLLAILTFATLSSYIIALFAWQADWNTDPLIRVTKLETQTSGGSPTTIFSAGNTVKVEATIEKASSYAVPYTVLTEPTTARILIVVYYDPGTGVRPLFYYTTTRVLVPGEPELVETQFTLSSSAASGTNKYYVHCLVWDSYLPNGDTLTDWTESQQEVTFSVS